jgi:predicted lipoprotein with Yx(FWY)xxD motif
MLLAVAAAVTLTSLGVAAAGGSTAKRHTQPTLQVRTAALGKILVTSKGRTLYLFEKDKGTKSECFGACAKNWPPLRTSGKPTVGRGLSASKVGTTKRSDGKRQVTYKGHPLYLFVQDTKPGDTKGQNLDAFGAEWYVLSPAGSKVDKSSGGGY